jgi:F-type H+-transporting ATPase subunit gamma
MADIRTIKRRIKGAQSVAKITRAMEMIATSKMRRAQERGLAGRPYSEKICQVITDLAATLPPETASMHPLLQRRPVNKIAIVLITPDRGLCGGLIGNMNRATNAFINEKKLPASLICVGRKGVDYARRMGRDIHAEFTTLGDRPSFLDTLPISKIIIDDFTVGAIDAVYIAYSQFVSVLAQKPAIEQILPTEAPGAGSDIKTDFIYEPNAKSVFEALLPKYVEMQIYHAILEAIASEQAARMVAMRNATENAGELIDDLSLAYNKARQENITKELLDITGGVEAMSH